MEWFILEFIHTSYSLKYPDWNDGGFRPYVRMSDNGDRLVVAMRNKQNNNDLAFNGLVQTYGL